MQRMKKKLSIITWLLIIAMGSYILFRGVSIILENQLISGRHFSGYIEYQVGMKAVDLLFPNLSYPFYNKEENQLAKRMYKTVFNQLPLFYYVDSYIEYETETESQMSFETIIQNEANDEYNYEIEESPVVVKETPSNITRMEEENAAQAVKNAQNAVETDFSYENLMKTYYNVESSTMTSPEELDAKKLLEKDMRITLNSEVPQILIYHTHSQEAFVDSVPGDINTTIMGVGDYLAELLRQKGFNVIHHKGVYDMNNGMLDRNKAYTLAEPEIKEILKQNPSIEVVIDLHRDGFRDNVPKQITQVNGKPTAKIMFVNGLSRSKQLGNIEYLKNPNLSDNLAFSMQLQRKGFICYPDFNRKILLKAYRYGLHLKPRTILVEAGSQHNTLQEEKNAMEPLSDILAQVLIGE